MDPNIKKYSLIDKISAMALTGGSDSNYLLGGHRLSDDKIPVLEDFYQKSLEWARENGTRVVTVGLRGVIRRADYYEGRVHLRDVKQFWIRVWRPYRGVRYNEDIGWSLIIADEIQITRVALSPSYVMREGIEYRRGIVETLEPYDGGLKVIGRVDDLSYEAHLFPDGRRELTVRRRGEEA